MGDTWRGVETSTKTGETDQGVTITGPCVTILENGDGVLLLVGLKLRSPCPLSDLLQQAVQAYLGKVN